MATMVHPPVRFRDRSSKHSWHQYNSGIGYQLYSRKESTLLAMLMQVLSQFLFKFMLIGLVSIGFLFCASAILASSAGMVPKIIALTAWACGFVPVSFHLWSR